MSDNSKTVADGGRDSTGERIEHEMRMRRTYPTYPFGKNFDAVPNEDAGIVELKGNYLTFDNASYGPVEKWSDITITVDKKTYGTNYVIIEFDNSKLVTKYKMANDIGLHFHARFYHHVEADGETMGTHIERVKFTRSFQVGCTGKTFTLGEIARSDPSKYANRVRLELSKEVWISCGGDLPIF